MRSRTAISAAAIAWLIYLGMPVRCFCAFLRFGHGAASLASRGTCLIGRYAALRPGLPLRASRSVSSPGTIGSGILLPADYADWDAEKLRIVLAHERSHIRQGDFYLQLLAALYAALFGSAHLLVAQAPLSLTWLKPSAIALVWSRHKAVPPTPRFFLNSRPRRANTHRSRHGSPR